MTTHTHSFTNSVKERCGFRLLMERTEPIIGRDLGPGILWRGLVRRSNTHQMVHKLIHPSRMELSEMVCKSTITNSIVSILIWRCRKNDQPTQLKKQWMVLGIVNSSLLYTCISDSYSVPPRRIWKVKKKWKWAKLAIL